MSGVPSRFCRIWAISFDDMFGASPFIFLPPCFIQYILYTFLHPPAVHPPDGRQARGLLPVARFLAAMLNNLDYTQVYTRNLGVGEKSSRFLSRFGDPPHLTGFNTVLFSFIPLFKLASP